MFYARNTSYVLFIGSTSSVLFQNLLVFLLKIDSKNIFTKNVFSHFKRTSKRAHILLFFFM